MTAPHGWPRRIARGVARRAGLAGPARGRGSDPFAAYRSVDGPPLVDVASVELDPQPSSGPRLVVLVPSLMRDRLTGGPNTAMQLGARVAARGVPVRFVATHGSVDDQDFLRGHLLGLLDKAPAAADLTFEAAVGRGAVLPIRAGDLAMATWWPTAYLADRTLAVSGRSAFLYLVQDFEPAFYPWSTSHVLALGTYAMAARPIFNTGLLREHFVREGIGRVADGTWFEPAVDTALFRPRARRGPRKLLFYARPGKPRNAFDLGLRALRLAVAGGAFEGDWEHWAIGEAVPELPLGRGAVLRPMPWKSLAEYATLLGESDVLLSLMLSPHPSYPPLEMAAAGGAVVTNVFGVKTADALARLSPRILAVEPEAAQLAGALGKAVRMPPATAQTPAATEGGERPGSWAAALEPVVDWILAALA
jgi:hypothetical protein